MTSGKIRKNDMVVVNAGVDRGKKGKVLHVIGGKGRALVEGIKLVKKCLKKSQENPQGGIAEKEASVAISNLMLFCPECKKGVKVGIARTENKAMRKCRKCGHSFDG